MFKGSGRVRGKRDGRRRRRSDGDNSDMDCDIGEGGRRSKRGEGRSPTSAGVRMREERGAR